MESSLNPARQESLHRVVGGTLNMPKKDESKVRVSTRQLYKLVF